MKDFMSAKCPCGREFKRPYPALQKNQPTAPDKKEVDAVAYALEEDLKYHQNKLKCLQMFPLKEN